MQIDASAAAVWSPKALKGRGELSLEPSEAGGAAMGRIEWWPAPRVRSPPVHRNWPYLPLTAGNHTGNLHSGRRRHIE